MGNFKKRIDSRKRIDELEKEFINVIEIFSDKNTDLTMNEVASTMLKMLTEWNDKERRQNIK